MLYVPTTSQRLKALAFHFVQITLVLVCRFSETMKQLDSGLISKKLSINSSTLLTQIQFISYKHKIRFIRTYQFQWLFSSALVDSLYVWQILICNYLRYFCCSSFILTLDSTEKTVCGRQTEQFDTPIRALNITLTSFFKLITFDFFKLIWFVNSKYIVKI